MNTLQIERDKLINAYKGGDSSVKELLIELFGSSAFSAVSADIREKFEAACKEQGKDPNKILHTGEDLDEEQIVANAYTMLRVLAKSRKKGIVLDFSKRDQKKWYSWYEYKPGVGFVVHGTYYDYTYTGTGVGSRLCFQDQQTARDFNNEFIELHRIVLEN